LAIYAFFQKHFGLSGDSAEVETDLPSVPELTVTPTGQLATSKGGKMIPDLNREVAAKQLNKLGQSRQNIPQHITDVKRKAIEISGYRVPAPDKDGPFINGRYQRDGYTVELDAIAGESGEYEIPLLLFRPDGAARNRPAIIYLHPKGKIADATPGGWIEKLVRMGFVVAAADILSHGEIRNTVASEHAEANTSVLIGRSMVGTQAGDIVRVANFLKTQNDVDIRKIGAIAWDELCIPLIHSAAFDSSIKNISLIGSLISYGSVVKNRFYKIGITRIPGHDYWHPVRVDFKWGVASALTAYDLPDLVGAIAPRKVAMIELKDQMLEPASSALIENEMKFPRSVYARQNRPGNLRIMQNVDDPIEVVRWMFE
jgi:hypothetical protein